MPLKRGNTTDPSPKRATVTSPRPSAKDDSAQSPWQDDAVLSVLSDDAARKAKLRARHSGDPPPLDKESRDYLRFRASGLQKPTPPRNKTPAQSAKTSGAKSGTAGRTASANPKGTPDQQMAVLSARLEHALGRGGPPRSTKELRLPSSGAKVSNKSAGAKTAAAGLQGNAKSSTQGQSTSQPSPKSPKAGGTSKQATDKQHSVASLKSPESPGFSNLSGFRFGVKPATPTGGQLPAIEGIGSLHDEAVEQNTPASSLEQLLDTACAADWNQLDASVAMPPPKAKPKPAQAKAKAMSEPTGVTAQKAGGPQDRLSAKTAAKKAEKKVNEAAFWTEAYVCMLRAEHGNAQGFTWPGSPIPEDLLTVTDMKEQKWRAMVYWSDVLNKNYTSTVRLMPEGALLGDRGHSFLKHLFVHMKATWLDLTEENQEEARQRQKAQIRAEKEKKAQRKRVEDAKKREKEGEALWYASHHDEENVVDYNDSDNNQAGDGKADSADVMSDDSTGAASPYFKRRSD